MFHQKQHLSILGLSCQGTSVPAHSPRFGSSASWTSAYQTVDITPIVQMLINNKYGIKHLLATPSHLSSLKILTLLCPATQIISILHKLAK